MNESYSKKIYNDILVFLKNTNLKNRLILFRGQKERDFLMEFCGLALNLSKSNTSPLQRTPQGLLKTCKKCTNTIEKKSVYGKGSNGIMIIINPPLMIAAPERKKHQSQSSELLKKMLQSIEVDMEECYITSMIKCETDDSLNKPSSMFNNCSPILSAEILFIKPVIIIVMGDMLPLKKIIDDNKKISWYTVEHPIALLKNPDLKRGAWSTLKLVREKYLEIANPQAGAKIGG